MSAHHSTQATIQMVGPIQAAIWLESAKYEHQRKPRRWHVENLAREMQRGTFTQYTQIRLAVSQSGRRALVDGQHRLMAVVESGIAQRFTVLETEGLTDEEIAREYGTLDVGVGRTAQEALKPRQLDQELGVTPTQINYLSAAIGLLSTGCVTYPSKSQQLHQDDLVRVLRLYAPFAREYFDLAEGCEPSIHRAVRRAPTIAVALLSLRFSAPRAAEYSYPSVRDFWRGVFFDDGIGIKDPRKFANRHLITSTMSARTRDKDTNLISAGYSVRYLGFCINAHIEGRMLHQPRVVNPIAPLMVYAVPRDPAAWLK